MMSPLLLDASSGSKVCLLPRKRALDLLLRLVWGAALRLLLDFIMPVTEEIEFCNNISGKQGSPRQPAVLWRADAICFPTALHVPDRTTAMPTGSSCVSRLCVCGLFHTFRIRRKG
jgi:hypothetical protein